MLIYNLKRARPILAAWPEITERARGLGTNIYSKYEERSTKRKPWEQGCMNAFNTACLYRKVATKNLYWNLAHWWSDNTSRTHARTVNTTRDCVVTVYCDGAARQYNAFIGYYMQLIDSFWPEQTVMRYLQRQKHQRSRQKLPVCINHYPVRVLCKMSLK